MTLNEYYIAVLQELGIVGAGEDANIQPEDTTLVAQRYTALYDMLLGERLTSWTLTDDIPSYAEQSVIKMGAYLCASAFQISPQRMALLEQAGALALDPRKGGPSLAERQLRRQIAKNRVPVPATSEYF
jgi:hypothetical protein